ncbi:polysaccharide biosynthesis/export family protein [Salmonirosea aquatica]|uniref:Soluble ligand binding domain-containing protein n=1 Tax=Salmonirosea aquatica TaxID=2654236 RepID=A0A7C9FYU8_9BACT|nr:hypothetical protein [Cytophagaceae bacterium SJW1-29]
MKRRATIVLFLLVVILAVSGCRTQQKVATISTQNLTPTESVVNKGAYVLKQGDKLEIRNMNWSSELFPDPNQLSGSAGGGFSVSVRSDGSIILPEVGRLYVVGFTRQTLADTLSVLYRDIVRNPLFEIEVTNLQVKVLGSVNAQGIVPLEKEYNSLGEIIAKSGGIKFSEASNTIQIIRGGGTQQQIIEYEFADLGNPLIMNQNIYDNDIIYVPPSRGSLRGIRFQRALVFAQPVLTALNLTLIILNFINR